MKHIFIFLLTFCHLLVCHSQTEVRTDSGYVKVGDWIKLAEPSNAKVYAHIYLESGRNRFYVSGDQYKGVKYQVKKIKNVRDKSLDMEFPVVIVGLPKQSRHYDLTIDIIAAVRKNEITLNP